LLQTQYYLTKKLPTRILGDTFLDSASFDSISFAVMEPSTANVRFDTRWKNLACNYQITVKNNQCTMQRHGVGMSASTQWTKKA
jgi:hypothetical protein